MHILVFLPYYAGWHYSLALRDLARNSKNLLVFIFRFFSIKTLFFTLFSPWERMGENYRKGLNLENWAETLIVNSIMRFVGFFIRSVTIVIGLAAFLAGALFIAAIWLAWLVMPVLLLLILALGIVKIFS